MIPGSEVPASARPGPAHGPWRALVAFHLGAGTRAALRASTIAMAVVLFAFGSAPDPAYTLMTFVRGVVAREPVPTAPPAARVAFAAFALALSAVGARRVALGAAGWPRSLPIAGRTARRAAWAAASAATLPLAAFAAATPALVRWLYHTPVDAAKAVGLPLLIAAAGAAALRVERVGARALAVVALGAAAWGRWPALALGVVALAAWDRWAGALAPPLARAPARGGPSRAARVQTFRAPPSARAGAMAVRWGWRAAGWQTWTGALAAAALPIAFAALMRANNPDLAPAARATIGRVGAALGIVACVAAGAGGLLARRPPWPWVRTLPWSATERVLADAVALGTPAALVGVAAAVAFGGAVATLVVASAGALVAATAAAGALRVGAHRQTGAVGELVLVATPAAVAFALYPAFAWVALPAAVALGALAARRERRAASAVRWNELRHDVTGDVGWIARV